MARSGRPPETGTPREKPTCVRFDADERTAIDKVRGTASRSDFIRRATNYAIRNGGVPE